MLLKLISRTRTISSYFSVKNLRRWTLGSSRRPQNNSLYMRATRAGVSRRPSRSGSSPTAAKISRTARSIRGRSAFDAVGAPLLSESSPERLPWSRERSGATSGDFAINVSKLEKREFAGIAKASAANANKAGERRQKPYSILRTGGEGGQLSELRRGL